MRGVAKPCRGKTPAAFCALRMAFLICNASLKNSVNRPLPLAHTGDSAFVGMRRWMRPVKYTHFTKQNHRNSAAFALAHLGTQPIKKALNVAPQNIRA
ncbi:hypothetical protein [Hydrogenophaga sp. 5NK40-0174]|uniref:hypothetical protein n=1 Tax=Hydrogenophaga sp. 5NK40-0174 TaxID=3127649 RepID=UPI003342825E